MLLKAIRGSNSLFFYSTHKNIKDILEDYKNTFGSTDGLMLGGDCSYLPDFETERFEWVIQTVRRWEGEQKNVSKDK